MAMKRCPVCGEKYSDTYKECPFCEEERELQEGGGRSRKSTRGGRRTVARGRSAAGFARTQPPPTEGRKPEPGSGRRPSGVPDPPSGIGRKASLHPARLRPFGTLSFRIMEKCPDRRSGLSNKFFTL